LYSFDHGPNKFQLFLLAKFLAVLLAGIAIGEFLAERHSHGSVCTLWRAAAAGLFLRVSASFDMMAWFVSVCCRCCTTMV
jgi:hypothetical protein